MHSISIAIPVYNQSASIRDAIESAVHAVAGFPNAEVVVSENYSDDGTREAVNEYSNIVRIVRPPEHVGMVENWNFAVSQCRNEWIGMLSGDDRIYRNYIPALRKALLKDQDAVFAFGGWNSVNTSTGKTTPRRVLSLRATTNGSTAMASLARGPKACFSSYCFRKDCFLELGGFPSEYKLVMDWILQFRLASKGSFVKTNEIISEYVSGQNREELERQRVPLFVADIGLFCEKTVWEALSHGVSAKNILEACNSLLHRAELEIKRFPEALPASSRPLARAYERIGQEYVREYAARTKPTSLQRVKQRCRKAVEQTLFAGYRKPSSPH